MPEEGSTGSLAGSPREEVLRRIELEGPITFADFMEMALYLPERGYYTSGRTVWGKEGDYLTSLDMSSHFAGTIAKEIHRMWELLGRPDPFTVIDAGAGRGLLSAGIARTARSIGGDFPGALRLVLIDVNPGSALKPLDGERVVTLSDISELEGPVTGVLLSNELLDALPFHRVEMTASGLKELYVDFADEDGKGEGPGELKEVLGELSSARLEDYFSALGITLRQGRRAEVSLAATDWIERAGSLLERGFVMTIDYGYPAVDLYAPERADTRLCHHRHKINDEPFSNIGSQDITAHVDFTSVATAGRRAGLQVAGFCSQQHFLIGAGILEGLIEVGDAEGLPKAGDADAIVNNQGIKKLIMPGGMGDIFKVLVQYKGMEAPGLQGFSFKNRAELLSQ